MAAQEARQACREQGACLAAVEIRFAADRPSQQQIPLVALLLRLAQPDVLEVPGAGVDAINGLAPQAREEAAVNDVDLFQQRGIDGRQSTAAERDLFHSFQIKVVSRADDEWFHGHSSSRYVRTVPAPIASARRQTRCATATSVVASPRCQKRIRSSARSRPGRLPATISPSSA